MDRNQNNVNQPQDFAMDRQASGNRQNVSLGNISSVGSLNTSNTGYNSGADKSKNTHADQPASGSSGGVEDLSSWIKIESSKKYEESLTKLGLDSSKIQGKHLVSYSLDQLQNEKKRVKNELKVYD